MKGKTNTVTLKWKDVTPDPVQWKPGLPTLEPVDVFVDVEVPEEMLARVSIGNITHLTPLGMAYVTKQLKIAMMIIEDGKKETKRS